MNNLYTYLNTLLGYTYWKMYFVTLLLQQPCSDNSQPIATIEKLSDDYLAVSIQLKKFLISKDSFEYLFIYVLNDKKRVNKTGCMYATNLPSGTPPYKIHKWTNQYWQQRLFDAFNR